MTLFDLQPWIVTPEIIVAIMACVILMLDALMKGQTGARGFGLAVSTLLVAAIAVVVTKGLGDVVGLFGLVVKDQVSDIAKFTICLLTAVVLIYGRNYTRERDLLNGEFLALTLFGTVGMMVMVSANILITI